MSSRLSLCHNCPVTGRIERGDFAGMEWEATPCAKCLAENGGDVDKREQGHGRILSYKDGICGWIRVVAGGRAVADEGMADAMELIRAFCVGIAESTDLQRRVLVMRLEGMTKAEVARELGKSRQCVESIWNGMARRCFARYDKRMVQ